MKKFIAPTNTTVYSLSAAITLGGLAGIIGHALSFDTQTSTVLNTFVACWFAGVFALSGFCLFYQVWRPASLTRPFYHRFEWIFTIWLGCCSLICLICYGLIREWSAFSWILVTFLPLSLSIVHLMTLKRGISATADKISKQSRVIDVSIIALKIALMLIAALLAVGGIVAAVASSFAPPRGSVIVSVYFDGANSNGNLQVYCIGKRNVSLPTIFIFATAAHGIVDFYGLQYYLNSLNGTDRRVCTHDPLGFGWSQDPIVRRMPDFEYFYRVMEATGEPTPWNIVGWGGGGSALAYLASNYTNSIKSVTFIETYPPDIEFDYYAYQRGLLDQKALADYRLEQLNSRAQIARLILYLAIPWGLISLFIPVSPQDPGYYPVDRWLEFKVQIWKSKAWVAQLQGIQQMIANNATVDPLLTFAPLPQNIPVFGVYCNVSTPVCFNGFRNLTGQDCVDRIKEVDYYNNQKFAMMRRLRPNANIITNPEYDCGLNIPVKKPIFTASSILRLYASIGV